MTTWIWFFKGQRYGKVQAADIIVAAARADTAAMRMGVSHDDLEFVTVRKEG